MQQGIFRKAALERLSSPEQLDQLMQVTSPKGWLSLLALLGLIVATVLWSIFGTIPTTVTGNGIIIHAGGVFDVLAEGSGQITDVTVDVGDLVYKGQVIATMQPTGEAVPEIVSQYDGRVIELLAAPGSLVQRGSSIITVEYADEPLQAVAYVPASVGKLIGVGMEAEVSPSTVKKEEFGQLIGKVMSVSPFPSTQDGMMRLLRNEGLVQELLRSVGGSPIEVHVLIIPDSDTPSGYKWSSGRGPETHISSGTITTTSVTIREQRPISLVLPIFQ